MNAQILIDSIVRQTTVLIAQLATARGLRAPLTHVAKQVFLDLARELDAQGISRKVSADMFGLALRSYRRRINRLSESETDRGRSLWRAVLEYLGQGQVVRRDAVLDRFSRDEEESVRAVLTDLCDSGLVFRIGSMEHTAYRAATVDELTSLAENGAALQELVWVLVYRQGPCTAEQIASWVPSAKSDLPEALAELVASGRVSQESDTGLYSTSLVCLPLQGKGNGEAAMLDHFQAVVQAMCRRIRGDGDPTQNGGCTYSFDVWDGHPMNSEVRGLLARARTELTTLRHRVEEFNATAAPPKELDRVVVYTGQSVIGQEEC